MLFVQVGPNENIEGLVNIGKESKLSAFVKHTGAVQELRKLFDNFERFSLLRINSNKTEVCVKKIVTEDLGAFS